MTTALSPEQRSAYDQRGYHFPIRAFSDTEAAGLCDRFLAHWRQYEPLWSQKLPRERAAVFIENHLFLRWVFEVVANPKVLDAVQSVLGPDVLVWSSQWFPKFPHDKSFVSWHQDAAYWGLSPTNVVTAWIALTPSTIDNGCMGVAPGSHRGALLPQVETYADANMLSRGQEIAVAIDPGSTVMMELAAGEFSLHHVGIAHGSGANDSDIPRIGLAVRYVSPDVVQQGRERDIVVLVRGRDAYGHFEPVDPPDRDCALEESRMHAESLARKRRNLLPADAV
jgi:hypothetical protein